jgi:lysozyme
MDIFEQLRRDEDEVLYAYPDSEGYLTIGVGILIDKRKGGGITKAESWYLLANRVKKAEDELQAALPWMDHLDEARRGLLVNMTFNLGIAGVLGFKHMLAAIEAGDYPRAAAEMRNSTWHKQVGDRAERLAKQMETGVWQ